MTHAELAEHARAEIARGRRTWLLLGALLLGLGVAGAGIVAMAASPADHPAVLIAVFGVVAILPGALMVRAGLARVDAHPLVVALAHRPGDVRSVGHAYQEALRGYRKLAIVELADGSTHSFEVPPERAPTAPA